MTPTQPDARTTFAQQPLPQIKAKTIKKDKLSPLPTLYKDTETLLRYRQILDINSQVSH